MPRALTRFELAVVVRVQVNAPRVLRHYLAVEAAMEELAGELELDRELAAMTGFAAAIDAQLCAHNPDRRGEVAAEMLRTESAPDAVVAAVVAARKQPADELEPLAAALLVTDVAVGAMLALVDDDDDDDDDEDGEDRAELGDVDAGERAFDQVTATAIARRIAIAARRDPSSDAARALAAADVIGTTLERVGERVLDGARRVRNQLRL